MRGGKLPGAGRPPKNDHYDNAWKVWAFVQKRTAETGVSKAAKADAEKEFGICRTTVIRKLEFVNKVFEILALLRASESAQFNTMMERIVSLGWFSDGHSNLREFEFLTSEALDILQ